ncbi:MAG: hypothetical protein QOK28_3861 [Actinomycetota bacterium]
MPHLHALQLLSTLTWDPQIRGFLIVVTAIALLPGTIYVLLSTNVGARIGFLLAIAGLSGWLMLLSITWTLYGSGMKGRDPSWKVKEVVHSQSVQDLSSAALPTLAGFPAHWHKAPPSVLGDSTAAADNFITKSGRKPKIGPEGPIIRDPTPEELRYPAEYATSDQYVVLDGYERGGDNCWGPKDLCTHDAPKKILFWKIHHKFFFTHSAHYVAVQLQAAAPAPNDPFGNATYTKNPDTTKPVVTVVVERDLGSVRFPQVMLLLSSGIIFFVTCHALHRRDKRIMALRAAGPAPATA